MRKVQQNIDLLMSAPLAWLVPIGLIGYWWVLLRPTIRAAAPWRAFLADPVLHSGALGVGILATAGFVLNDTGVAIPGALAAVGLPLMAHASWRITHAPGPGHKAAEPIGTPVTTV